MVLIVYISAATVSLATLIYWGIRVPGIVRRRKIYKTVPEYKLFYQIAKQYKAYSDTDYFEQLLEQLVKDGYLNNVREILSENLELIVTIYAFPKENVSITKQQVYKEKLLHYHRVALVGLDMLAEEIAKKETFETLGDISSLRSEN